MVNLRQEENAVRNFFKRYSSLVGKCIFLISAYQRRNPYIKRNFVRDHKIHPDRVAVIPYNLEFQAQCLDGRIVNYISEHYNCRKGAQQYEYILCLKKAARMLMGLIDEKLILSGEKGGICADG